MVLHVDPLFLADARQKQKALCAQDTPLPAKLMLGIERPDLLPAG